jgi:glycosyltransferase involved in cell wall biosynthesis
MKILCVHNYYGSCSPSGENTVFNSEIQLLREHGHQVIEYVRHSDEIRQMGGVGSLIGGLSVPWNHFTLQNVRELIAKEKPHVMHVHNTFPLISPSIFYATRGTKTSTILTLHNYRLFCANAILLRQNKQCTICLEKNNVTSALKHGCYRDSRLATMPLALSTVLHRKLKTWQKQVDAFIALTEFQRGMMLKAGLAEEKVFVKPHFYSDPPAPREISARENKAIYIGRLGPEKGVGLLLDVWKIWGNDAPYLEIIGSGLEEEKLQRRSVELGLQHKIHFLGQLSFQQTQTYLQRAKVLLLPSLCFEGFPMVIREAFALGVPVIASRLGSMACLIDDAKNGFLFETGDAHDLLHMLKKGWLDQDNLAKMGENARGTFESQYTANANYNKLMRIYQAASLSR